MGTSEGFVTEIESPSNSLTAYFEEPPNSDFYSALKARFSGLVWHESQGEERDWLAEWRKGFQAFLLAEPFWIVPSWLNPPSEAKEFLRIDPGMAFGTGTHETTRMAAAFVLRFARQSSFLDVGTGSGILAMLGAKMGATSVMALDNDPEAVRVARENAKANGLELIQIEELPLSQIQQQYDLIAANIIENVLLDLKVDLQRALKPGGKLILSGILVEQCKDFLEAFLQESSLQLMEQVREGMWAGFLLFRRS